MTISGRASHLPQQPRATDIEGLSAPLSSSRTNLAKPIHFIDNAAFREPHAWGRFVETPYPSGMEARSPGREKAEISDQLSILVAAPMLSREQERYLFLRMNFLKHEAELVRRQILEGTRDPSAVSEISNFLESAMEARNHIVAANTRLLIFVAKKYASPSLPVHELVGIGSEGLIRATNFFDCDHGSKFSTYASTALFHFLARSAGKFTDGTRAILLSEMKHREFSDPKAHSSLQDVEYRDLKEKLGEVIAQLPPREALIIRRRFFEDATYQDIADTLGVSKQRIQQMQVEILWKLRAIAGNRFDRE